MTPKEIENYKKAGKIAKEAVTYAKTIIKPDILLVDIAEKIEKKILDLGGEIAFPCNLCINEIAAHYSPTLDDKTKATGLLKIDIGVHINGAIADTAFSLDLTKNKEHKELIEASEKALEQALNSMEKNQNITLSEIGKTIQDTITTLGFSPIRNLSGHQLGKFLVHAGATIPNYENNNLKQLEQGAYAIEPFATKGEGIVKDGGKSNIYRIEKKGTGIRDPIARKIYTYVLEKYKTLPFSARDIEKKFGTRSKIALMFLEKQAILHHYAQLIEKSHSPVSQAEHTIILKEKIEVTTK